MGVFLLLSVHRTSDMVRSGINSRRSNPQLVGLVIREGKQVLLPDDSPETFTTYTVTLSGDDAKQRHWDGSFSLY
jgi:hypothetical protein